MIEDARALIERMILDAPSKMIPGYWWRWSRSQAERADADAADAEWISLYGQEAFDKALTSTAWVLDLEFPPPADPRSSGVLPADDPLDNSPLVIQAAWGGPRLWPAHQIADISSVQRAQTRLMYAHTPAVESAHWA